MRGILVDENVRVYAEPNNQNLSITMLKKGDEFELGKVVRKKREVWVQITLPSEQTGYISGETRIFEVKRVQFLTDQVAMRDAASDDANLVKNYEKNAVVTAIGVENTGAKGWVKIKDDDGNEGFIRGDARIKVYQEVSVAGSKKLMLTGGIFTIIGLAFLIVLLVRPQTSDNTSVLLVALLAFGVLQLGQGYLQYRKAKKEEQAKKLKE